MADNESIEPETGVLSIRVRPHQGGTCSRKGPADHFPIPLDNLREIQAGSHDQDLERFRELRGRR